MTIGRFIQKLVSRDDIKDRLSSSVDEDLLEEELECQEKLARVNKDLGKNLAIICAFFIPAIIVFIALACNLSSNNTVFIALSVAYIAIFIIVLICFLIRMSNARKEYHNASPSYHIKGGIIGAIYSDEYIYRPHDGYDLSELRMLNAFEMEEVDQWEYIEGYFDGVWCSQADVQTYHHEEYKDQDGNIQERVVYDFTGMVFKFKNNKKINGRIYLTNGVFARSDIKFESQQFNSVFKVSANYREEAFYIITPQMQEAILELASNFDDNKIQLIYKGDLLYVVLTGIQTHVNRVEIERDISENISNVISNIYPMAYIISTLRLDHRFTVKE